VDATASAAVWLQTTLNGLTATIAELNYVDGVTSNIQTQLGTKLPKAGGTMTGDVSLGDNVKAKFGAGDDLEIYHDPTYGHSHITESGTGNLKIQANNIYIKNADDTANYIHAGNGAEVALYHNNALKLATTATGVDVTGSVTCDGFTSTGIDDNATSTAITIDASENVGIGTASPDAPLHVEATNASMVLSNSGRTQYWRIQNNESADDLLFNASDASEKLRIQSGGGISFNGDTAAANALDDYEEGTWTPTAVGGFTGFNINSANYTKIGRSVTVNAYVNAMAGASANAIVVGGLPFTSIGSSSYHTGVLDTSNSYTGVARVRTGSTSIDFYKTDSTTSSYLGTQNTGHMIFSLTYQTS
jgi:hypothetical protein